MDEDERAAAAGQTLSSESIELPEEYDDRSDPLHDTTDRPDLEGWEDDPFGQLATGAQLGGRYRLERVIGRGATGVVFEASHLVIGKRVALKCLYPHHRAAPNAVERFFREAKIAATVEHPNVIQVFDGGDEKDTMFLAMELLHGRPLGDRIDRDGPLEVEEAIRIFLGIMGGVAAVHEAGVVHRDLKPDNIFLVQDRFTERAEPKVLDFGISKLKEPGMRELTTLGTVMGTPFYMAPEQITNTRDVDVRADVYSLGVMLYEALAGAVPYAGESVLEIFRAAQEASATPLDEARAEVSPQLAQVVARAMHPKREERYASMAELAEALRALDVHTDPSRTSPPVVDVRATVRDVVMSPFRALENAGAAVPRTPTSTSSPGPGSREERRTVPLQRPLIIERDRTPAWVLPTLIGAGVLTVASVGVALLALFL